MNPNLIIIIPILVAIRLPGICCALSFPPVGPRGTGPLKRSFHISKDNFQNLHRQKNIIIPHPKQFGVVTRQKSTDYSAKLCPSTSGISPKDCEKAGFPAFKVQNFLKIQTDAAERNQASDMGKQRLLGKQTDDNKQLFSHLSSLVRSAADVMNLLRKVATRERAAPHYVQRSIHRRHSVQRLLTTTTIKQGWMTRTKAPTEYSPGGFQSTNRNDTQKSKRRMREDGEWAELLFGPRGVLTAIFHILDDRRLTSERTTGISEGGNEGRTTESYHQADLSLLPDFLTNAKPVDFAKIFEAFLTGSKGDFDERISNLPEILGICNRLSCGDIYKAIDEFRRSEFFTNFQTALQLIQDPKGWEIIGDLISNPELIAQFMNGAGGGDGLGNLFGSISGAKKSSKNNSKGIGPGDGDLGIDFSKMVEGNSGASGGFRKEHKPTAEELPEIAENVDAVDYYNAVERGTDMEASSEETVTKPDIMPPAAQTPPVSTTVFTAQPEIPPRPAIPDLSLPEIAESIDGNGYTEIIIDVTSPRTNLKKFAFLAG